MSRYELLTPGNVYHIYNRGNNNEQLFYEEPNYHYFLRLWKKHTSPVAYTISFIFLPNHFHFIVYIRSRQEINWNKLDISPKISDKDLILCISKQFSNFFNAYAQTINKNYPHCGSVFQERFRRKRIPYYVELTKAIDYIHRNCEKHGLVQDFKDYPYSSYRLSLLFRRKKKSQVDSYPILNCLYSSGHTFEEKLIYENIIDYG